MPDPTPPEPIFDSNLFSQFTPSSFSWQSAGVTDPGGTALGTLVNSGSGAQLLFGPAYGGAIGDVQWSADTSNPGNGFGPVLMTSADATKLLASGASISGGKLVSGGTSYNARLVLYSATKPVFQLVAA